MKRVCCIGCLFFLLLSSCSTKPDNNELTNSNSGSSIIRYDVYQHGVMSEKPDEFSIAMNNNPIDLKMANDLCTQNIAGTNESQVFFDSYVQIWKDELSFSIDNLKKYISEEDSFKLDTVQIDWENSWKSNNEFDRSIIEYNEIKLGSQYLSSLRIYLINQYRERIFHIKYMTYLLEKSMDMKIPQSDYLWCKFYPFD